MIEDVFDRTLIQKYAEKNTSPKMPVERKYLQAFVDAMLNSSVLKEKWAILMDEMQNGDSYMMFNSFWRDAKMVNKEPNRSVVAYSMLKKDMRLFELMSASEFTGSVEEYHGSDLYTDIVKDTDEVPVKFTDKGGYTDMSEGIIQIGFKNVFCEDPQTFSTEEDPPKRVEKAGYEWQTLDELNAAVKEFEVMATMCKPARVIFLLFFVRYCWLSGDKTHEWSVGIKNVMWSPFGDARGENTSMDILNSMSDEEVLKCYNVASMYDGEGNQMFLECERNYSRVPNYIILSYEFKTQENDGVTWGTIKLEPSMSDKIYVRETRYKVGEDHSEKYVPVMLGMGDGSGNALAFCVRDGVAGLFFMREKADE